MCKAYFNHVWMISSIRINGEIDCSSGGSVCSDSPKIWFSEKSEFLQKKNSTAEINAVASVVEVDNNSWGYFLLKKKNK